MHAVWRLLRATAALLVLGLALAAPALASSPFYTLFHEYQSTGSIKACKHSTSELQAAKNASPPDILQYAPDFPAALQSALETRAHGGCGGAAAAAAGPAPAGTPGAGAPGGSAPAVSGTAPGATPAPLGSPAAASPIAQAATHVGGGGASSAPIPLIALALVLVALAGAAIWWTVTTLRGDESPRLSSAGHVLGEVRLRAGGTLREFADWLRLGR